MSNASKRCTVEQWRWQSTKNTNVLEAALTEASDAFELAIWTVNDDDGLLPCQNSRVAPAAVGVRGDVCGPFPSYSPCLSKWFRGISECVMLSFPVRTLARSRHIGNYLTLVFEGCQQGGAILVVVVVCPSDCFATECHKPGECEPLGWRNGVGRLEVL